MIVDLSHRLEPDMPAYPGLPVPQFHTFLAHGDAGKHTHYSPGTSFQIATYEFAGNTGTYVDAPFHRYPNGADLADVSLDRLVDLAGALVDAPEEGAIEERIFSGIALRGKAVLVHTGWSRRWRSDGYFRSGPYLTGAACEHLVNSGAAMVGIDCANIDNMNDRVAAGPHCAAGSRYSNRRASAGSRAAHRAKLPILCRAARGPRGNVVSGAGLCYLRVSPACNEPGITVKARTRAHAR